VGVGTSEYGPADNTLRFATYLGSFVSTTMTFLLSEEMPTLFNTVKSLKSYMDAGMRENLMSKTFQTKLPLITDTMGLYVVVPVLCG